MTPPTEEKQLREALRYGKGRLMGGVIDNGGILHTARKEDILSVWNIPALNVTLSEEDDLDESGYFTDSSGNRQPTNHPERKRKAEQCLFDIAVYLLRTPSRGASTTARLSKVNQKLPEDLRVTTDRLQEIKDYASTFIRYIRDEEERLSQEAGEIPGADDLDPEITDEIQQEAIEILTSGDPLRKIRETYGTLHSGDQEVIDVFVIGFCAGSATNSQGVQPALTGSKGAGKTSAAQAATHLLPREYLLSGTFSNKALLYCGLKPGMVLFSDDTVLSEDINDLIKRAMSNYQQPTEYLTLDGDRNPVTLTIPPRQTFLFTSISDQGDDQLSDRQYKVGIDVDPERDQKYAEYLQKKAITGEPDYPTSRDVLICRAIFREIRKNLYRVEMPFFRYVKWNDTTRRRVMRFHLDFVAGMAILNHRRREQGEPDENGVITLTATPEDLTGADPIFETNEDTRKLSLTREERALWEFFISQNREEIPLPDLKEAYTTAYKHQTGRDLTDTTFRRMLYGRSDRSRGPDGGGLIGKLPGAEKFKEVTTRDLGGETARRERVVIKLPRDTGGLSGYSTFYTFNRREWERHQEQETGNGDPNGE